MKQPKQGERAWLRALGDQQPPEGFALGDRRFRREGVYKHDFFAATARYVDDEGRRVVLKLGRHASLWGIPLGWLGRLVTWNEARALVRLGDLPCVPGLVARPRPGALVRSYVEGTELARGAELPADFFRQLDAGIEALHERGWAYNDLEKPQNVIVGEDGRPYLCDFQISWSWPRRLGGGLLPFRWWLGVLQRADRYHRLKLERRVRPEGMSAEDLALSRQRPFPSRVHGWVMRPFQAVRRRLLGWLEPGKVQGERGRQNGTPFDKPRPKPFGPLQEKRS